MSDSTLSLTDTKSKKGEKFFVAREVLGHVLRSRRKNRHMTLDEASKKLNVSISTLYRIEHGGRNIAANEVAAMCVVYDCAIAEVWSEVDTLLRERHQHQE